MEIKVCCFTGHRTLSDTEYEELVPVIDRYLLAMCEAGCTEFRTGGALGFDTLAAQRVLALREQHPQCKLHLILPCRGQESSWALQHRVLYRKICERADRVSCLHEIYEKGCMYERNRALVDGCDVVIAYLKQEKGGTAYTCRYAKKQGVRIINVARTIEQQLSFFDEHDLPS